MDKGTRMSTGAVRPGFYLLGVQTEGVDVSTVGVMTDLTNVQVVRETTYASVASKASPKVVAGPAGVDIEIGGIGGCPSGPPPSPVCSGVPVPEVVWAQALLIHRVDYRRSLRALLVAARGLRVGECGFRGVRWLLGVGRRWGKHLSLVVVYLDSLVVVRGYLLLIRRVLHFGSATALGGECAMSLPEGALVYCGRLCGTIVVTFLCLFSLARVRPIDSPLRVLSLL